MRRVEVNSNLSPKLLRVLQTLLDIPQQMLQSAWSDCSRSGRGYFVTKVRQETSGKIREIHHPSPQMKEIQRRILTQILYQLPTSKAAYGGVPGRSYVQAAKLHLSQPGYVLQLDVTNAFQSTTYGAISKYLRTALKTHLWVFQLSRKERMVIVSWLTHLMVVNPLTGAHFPRLPLGTPTSIAIFNVLWGPIDSEIQAELQRLTPNTNIRYTRYVDDITISSDQPLHLDIMAQVRRILSNYQYELNHTKTKSSTRDQAIIHGLCWENHQVSLPEKGILSLSKRVHQLQGLLHGHPTPEQWREAARLHQELERILVQIYGDQPRPQGLIIQPELLEHIQKNNQRTTPRWADELWG